MQVAKFIHKPAPDTPDEADLLGIRWKAGVPEDVTDEYAAMCLRFQMPWRLLFEEVIDEPVAVKRGPGRPKKPAADPIPSEGAV